MEKVDQLIEVSAVFLIISSVWKWDVTHHHLRRLESYRGGDDGHSALPQQRHRIFIHPKPLDSRQASWYSWDCVVFEYKELGFDPWRFASFARTKTTPPLVPINDITAEHLL